MYGCCRWRKKKMKKKAHNHSSKSYIYPFMVIIMRMTCVSPRTSWSFPFEREKKKKEKKHFWNSNDKFQIPNERIEFWFTINIDTLKIKQSIHYSEAKPNTKINWNGKRRETWKKIDLVQFTARHARFFFVTCESVVEYLCVSVFVCGCIYIHKPYTSNIHTILFFIPALQLTESPSNDTTKSSTKNKKKLSLIYPSCDFVTEWNIYSCVYF